MSAREPSFNLQSCRNTAQGLRANPLSTAAPLLYLLSCVNRKEKRMASRLILLLPSSISTFYGSIIRCIGSASATSYKKRVCESSVTNTTRIRARHVFQYQRYIITL
uniref:Uncharacterized protein n=1 Tax=Coccidioides posadasii RMSCC 3488 TaxID=454284 RepID=A0A0J6I1K6_COCPO|nr:hypothetical protein CPAG_01504 [Coccidioides posadasii RMSCC 3488]